MNCIPKLKILSFTDYISANDSRGRGVSHLLRCITDAARLMKWAESGSTSPSTSTLAQHRMKVSAEDSALTQFFFYSELPLVWNCEPKHPLAAGTHKAKHVHPSNLSPTSQCEPPSAKGEQLEGGSLQSRSEVISSKDFCYINISNNILMYLRYFQFKMAGTKPIWSLSATMVTQICLFSSPLLFSCSIPKTLQGTP